VLLESFEEQQQISNFVENMADSFTRGNNDIENVGNNSYGSN